MKNVIDVLYYTEDFTNKIINEVFTIYDLWSIRPLQNIRKVLCSGLASDPDSFRRFMEGHANKEKPVDLLIYVGNGEKNYPLIMYTRTKKAIKVRFDHYHPNSIGRPLNLSYM